MKDFPNFLKCDKVYRPTEINEVISIVRENFRFSYQNKKLKYFNVPCAFDIETTSFSRGDEYIAIMYEWTFGIYGLVIIGREWDEFFKMLKEIQKILDLNSEKRLIIYVHNLSFEFQFIRKWLQWKKVFAIENRKPVYAVSEIGIEFRCSYILSGYALETLGNNLLKYDIKKMTGDLDYRKVRHSHTKLTEKEKQYCINDVKIVMAYITDEIERNGGISKIPLTKTSYARRYCRSKCFENAGYRKYISGLTLSATEFIQLKNAFQGGFTHCNPFYSDVIINDVWSFDFTSSYPTVMISEMFPASKGKRKKIHDEVEFRENLKYYCCLFDITFRKIRPREWYENYISLSRCRDVKNPVVNNGRIVTADEITITITEQDFAIIEKLYEWESYSVKNFIRYKKDYLPKEFIDAVLTLYENKTKLKGVSGREAEYMNSKELLNSLYGMIVTSPVRDSFEYVGDEWKDPEEKTKEEIKKCIEKYNKNKSRFSFFPWGVWVTAYARRNLFTGIIECKGDYIYSDTDSIKIKNHEKHSDYIARYNVVITEKLKKTMIHYNFDLEKIMPETIDGIKKSLGVWDFDGEYKRFKSLGAKRYLVEYSTDPKNGKNAGKMKLTVSGLNKEKTVPFLKRNFGKAIFENFKRNLYVPAEYTGKMTHRYIDFPASGELTDYRGITFSFYEKSFIHLENADYRLSISEEYTSFLKALKGGTF